MKRKIVGIFVCTLMIATALQAVGGGSRCTFQYEVYDVGVGEPTNIHDGDYRLPGEDSLFVTVRNNGDLPAITELDFTLEREEWIPIVVLDEGFEDVSCFPPQGWQIHHEGNQNPWHLDTIIGHDSPLSSAVSTIWPPTPPMKYDEWLVTDSYDLSDILSPSLSFWYYNNWFYSPPSFNCSLKIWVHTDGGTTPPDFESTGTKLVDIPIEHTPFWTLHEIDISSFSGEEDVHFAFSVVGDDLISPGNFIEVLIDDVKIEGEGYDWVEVDSGGKGPYDLDPDAWIESFFDVFYDVEGYYRATFSLDTPLNMSSRFTIGNDWFDDNPDNDVYQAVFTVTTNNPPNKPACSYDSNSDELVVTVTDPDGDQIKYGVDWDNDGTIDQWTEYVNSGTEQLINCGGRKGTVGVVAEDEHGAQSDWVSINSKNKAINSPFLSFLEHHPHLFPLLQKLLGLET